MASLLLKAMVGGILKYEPKEVIAARDEDILKTI